MSAFTDTERAYLTDGGPRLGRLATVDPTGQPRVVPLGWHYNADLDTIDIGGRDPVEFVATRKFKDVQSHPQVAFIVDDVLPPWRPRSVIVHGTAEAIDRSTSERPTALIRITPTRVISWGLDGD